MYFMKHTILHLVKKKNLLNFMKLTVICNRVSKQVGIQDFDLYRCLRKKSVEQDGEQMPSCL